MHRLFVLSFLRCLFLDPHSHNLFDKKRDLIQARFSRSTFPFGPFIAPDIDTDNSRVGLFWIFCVQHSPVIGPLWHIVKSYTVLTLHITSHNMRSHNMHNLRRSPSL